VQDEDCSGRPGGMPEVDNLHQEREESKECYGIQYRQIFDKRDKVGTQMHELREVE
jgi:hypothetical protein